MKILILGIVPKAQIDLKKLISNDNVTIVPPIKNTYRVCFSKYDFIILTRFIKHDVVNQIKSTKIQMKRINGANIKEIAETVKLKLLE